MFRQKRKLYCSLSSFRRHPVGDLSRASSRMNFISSFGLVERSSSTPRPILFCSVRLAAPRLPGRCVAGRLTSCRLRSSASETPAKPRQQSKPRRSQPRRATRSLTGRKSWHATCNTTLESPSSSLKKFVAATNGPGIPFARFRAFLLTRMKKQRAAANSKPGWVIAVVLTNLSERRLQQPQLWSAPLPRIPFLGRLLFVAA